MADAYISGLTAAGAIAGTELIEVSQLSSTVTMTATTLSAQASDNSFNDSANAFITEGFAVGDRVNVTGFTGNTANNIFAAQITALTAGKMTIGGTDGDVIVDDAAGESVTITKWVTRRTTASALAGLASSNAPNVQAVTSAATVTPTFSNDLVKITAQAAALALANWSGTPVPAWGMGIRIKDNGTARAITYGSKYRAIGVTLPSTTVVNKTLYLGVIYNADDDKFDVLAVRQEA